MAWRIDRAVIRGEIDNRERGRVTGRIWLAGWPDPIELNLQGNCWRDLAGRRLEFSNPNPELESGGLDKFARRQDGVVGDITASRRVKVPEIPLEQIGEYYLAKKPFPWHWGNSLYLEWHGALNGRVVIESAEYNLKVLGEPAWEMVESEEEEQRRLNGVAMTGFMDRLVQAAEAQGREAIDDTPPEWTERPQTEAEAEAQQARSDRLADRIEGRLQREGEKEYDKILEEELDRLHREESRSEPTPEQLLRQEEWIEEMNRASEEALANPDPEVEKELKHEHPLVTQVSEFAFLWRETAKAEGWCAGNASREHPINEFLDSILIAGPKFAGALNGYYWPPEVAFCAHTIVRLKRARSYLEDALRASESCHEENLVKPEYLGPMVVELTDFIRETDELITELRAKLERGTD